MGQGDYPLDVELAKRRSYASRRPRGVLVLAAGTDEEERLAIPAAVARSLHRRLAAGELVVGSRAEALWQLGETSRACAVSRVEGLLNRRDYAEGEMRRKLAEDGFGQKVIDDVLARAKAGRALDDARFAEAFIRSKVNAGWGRLRIERELSQRGIEAADVEGWPEEYLEAEGESERAYELARRRRLTGTNDYAKLMRFLLARGFSAAEATPAVRRILAEAEEDGEGE